MIIDGERIWKIFLYGKMYYIQRTFEEESFIVFTTDSCKLLCVELGAG